MKTRDISRKSRVRATGSRDWRGTRSSKQTALADPSVKYSDPTICNSCGASYTRRTWRSDRPVTHLLLQRAEWAKCPACHQKSDESGFGKVVIRGHAGAATRAAMQRRIRNVATRAARNQPEHKIVSIEQQGDRLELLTSTQQLAHRVVHELKKAFGGRASYRWSDADGSLYSTWYLPAEVRPLR